MIYSDSQKRLSARRRAILGAAALVLTGAALPLAAQGDHQHHGHHRHQAPEPTAPRSLGAMSIPDTTLRDQDGREVRFYSDLVAGRGDIIAANLLGFEGQMVESLTH